MTASAVGFLNAGTTARGLGRLCDRASGRSLCGVVSLRTGHPVQPLSPAHLLSGPQSILRFNKEPAGLVSPAPRSPAGDIMPRQIIFTPTAAKPPATYSQATKAAGLIFISGTAPSDPATGKLVGATIQEQTRQCLTNIAAILEAAGSSLDRLVSATVVLADEDDFPGMNEEWLRWFPADPPARQGAKLPVRVPGLRISIAGIAEA
jgi:2-iminobutanoate/2-iminopropanoate deaminase